MALVIGPSLAPPKGGAFFFGRVRGHQRPASRTAARENGREILDDNLLGLSAQTAYYFFFSLFPLFLFAAPLIGFIGERQEIRRWLIVNLRQAVPKEAVDLVDNVVRDVLTQTRPASSPSDFSARRGPARTCFRP